MITTFYFIRHAEPNYNNHDDVHRELTAKGLQDSQRLIPFFEHIKIDEIFSSPYQRAIETIMPLANHRQIDIKTIDDFRERKIDDVWIEDFDSFSKQQWQDKTYKLAKGESLQEVQERQVKVINQLLSTHHGKTIIVGSHGTALSSLINYYQPQFSYENFEVIKHLFPFVAQLTFNRQTCQSISIDNIFTGEHYDIYSI